ncbi:hypothetical protein SALBM217S_09672 [Streptomyces griseoloalbus]
MIRYVYAFTEGDRGMADLLGGKGANLAEMTRLGLPVPPGFTVTTEACRTFLATGSEPAGLARQISDRLAGLEEAAGRCLGQPDDPLLVSVRSGARFSMPGMMETILDIGLDDDSVQGLAKSSGNERFAWDSYRRLVQMFGSTVMGVGSDLFEEVMADLKHDRSAANDLGLDAADLAELVETYKELIHQETGESFRSPRPSSCSVRCWPSSSRGTPSVHACTAGVSTSPTTSAPRSTCRPWSSATSGPTPAAASPSPATRPPAGPACTATTWPTHRARTSSPASATPCRWTNSDG